MSTEETYFVFIIKYSEIQIGLSTALTPSIRVKIPEIKEHKMLRCILHKLFTKHKLQNYNFVFSIDSRYLKYSECIFELPVGKCAVLTNMFSVLMGHSQQKRTSFLVDRNTLWSIAYLKNPNKFVDKVFESEMEVLQELEKLKCTNVMLLGEVRKDQEFKERVVNYFKDIKQINFVKNKDFEIFIGTSIFSALEYTRKNMMFTASEYVKNKDSIIKTWCWL